MLLGVCTQLLPEYTGLTSLHIQNKAMMMLIPEFPWPCRSLITKLLNLSSPALPQSPSLRAVSRGLREQSAPTEDSCGLTAPSSICCAGSHCSWGRKPLSTDTVSWASHCVAWCRVLFRRHQIAGATVCSTDEKKDPSPH